VRTPTSSRPARKLLTAAATAVATSVSTVVVGLLPPLALATPAAAVDRPAVQPLPANLEAIRASEANQLYGSPGIRPLEQRRTSLLTMGDSEISGEGVGNYIPGTHQEGNWCDRSYDQALFRTAIASDEKYNIACSGAQPRHLVEGSGFRQHNELNQGDHLAIKARNTWVKLIWVVVGANGPNTIMFAPVVTDCSVNRVFFLGPCYGDVTDVWATRVNGSRQEVEAALQAIRQTMTRAGYLQSDYELVLQSYPSPVGPDVEDNPGFPGWYGGGCLLYLHDLAFARNKAVPMFEGALRAAAANTGTRYLDNSRLFDGHGVCDTTPWVRGLFIEVGVWNENAARQSYHPNARGHGAFADCMTQFYNSGLPQASCVEPPNTGVAELRPGLLEFKQLRNAGTGNCVDSKGYDSRNRTVLQAYTCHGGRNQGFWYDPAYRSLHVQLSHDRCLDVKDVTIAAGKAIQVYNCHNGPNQQWVLAGNQLKPASNTGLCVAFNNPSSGRPQLRLAACGSDARQQWAFESRNFADPVGYGHDDFIGDRVY